MLVVPLDDVCDFINQFFDTAEGSMSNGSLRDDIEPDLHLVKPRSRDWRVMDMSTWMCR